MKEFAETPRDLYDFIGLPRQFELIGVEPGVLQQGDAAEIRERGNRGVEGEGFVHRSLESHHSPESHRAVVVDEGDVPAWFGECVGI